VERSETYRIGRGARRIFVIALRLGSAALVVAILYLVFGYAAQRSLRAQLDERLEEARNDPMRPGPVVAVDPWVRGCGKVCEGGYRDFVALHSGKAPSLGWRQTLKILRNSSGRDRSQSSPLERGRLAERIRSALAIDELLTGIDERVLVVAEITQRSLPGVVEHRLLFGDVEIGTFEALLLLPSTPGPHPAIIGLHGHRDDADVFAAEYMGHRLAGRGFVVLVPTLRAHDCSVGESLVALRLLRNGATLMGLKVYETLLLVKYLDSLSEVEPGRIGILGHSGGASIANLVVRLSDRFGAKVTDLRIDYDNRCGPLGVHCETVPAMIPLTEAIDDERLLSIPSLEVPYGFPEPASRKQIEAFFQTSLQPRR
jgi:hypothetical protein